MSLIDVANQLNEIDKPIVLVYAFNGTGKTQLSVAYKNVTKEKMRVNTLEFIIMPIVKIYFTGIMMKIMMGLMLNSHYYQATLISFIVFFLMTLKLLRVSWRYIMLDLSLNLICSKTLKKALSL
ncbi:hypothetical protein LQM11_000392 [Vibrio parahaemolyticus]|nr:hypothetical protein [Vibrio parahaemolyticus]